MEHEVFIPVPAETLREALRDHARVARCVPGLQQDADESARPLSGRLKVRVGGHTITYRGAMTLTERAGAFTAKGEGSEIRGTGSARLSVRIRLREAAGGTTVAFTATTTSEGRLSEIAPSTSETTARRLLDRFATALGASGAVPPTDGSGPDRDSTASGTASGAEAHAAGPVAADGSGDGEATSGPEDDVAAGGPAAGAAGGSEGHASASGVTSGADADGAGSVDSGGSGDGAGAGQGGDVAASGAEADSAGDGDLPASGAAPGAEPDDAAPADSEEAAPGSESDDAPSRAASGADSEETDPGAEDSDRDDPDVPHSGDFDAPVPPSALDASVEFGVTSSGEGDFLVPLDPPAEAAHARRTMIGRSAEEVDHAPPRGRYAPERAPDTGGPGAALRWVAPAAALAIAGAVVVGRALRRRR